VAWQEQAEAVAVEKTVVTLASLARQFALCRDHIKVLSSDNLVIVICIFE